tara:strand:- start:2000 stop:2281 length:282 start_codon:yes stop_codon:yes gene_type:complete
VLLIGVNSVTIVYAERQKLITFIFRDLNRMPLGYKNINFAHNSKIEIKLILFVLSIFFIIFCVAWINDLLPFIALTILLAFIWRQANKISLQQ